MYGTVCVLAGIVLQWCYQNDKERDNVIRKLKSADRKDYLEMAQAFYGSDAVNHAVPSSYFEQTFAELMRSDVYAEGYLMEENGEAVGYALLAKTYSQEAGGPVVWIDELYLKPSQRGKGLGSGFFSFLQKTYPNTARFRLEAEPDNDRAMALYRRLGYKILPYVQLICEKKEATT